LFLLANLLLTSARSACPKLKMPVVQFAKPVFAEGEGSGDAGRREAAREFLLGHLSATAPRSLAQTRQSPNANCVFVRACAPGRFAAGRLCFGIDEIGGSLARQMGEFRVKEKERSTVTHERLLPPVKRGGRTPVSPQALCEEH
jgi:hypothetical protein